MLHLRAFAALVLSVVCAVPAFSQVPPFAGQWGGFGPGDTQFQNPVGVVVDQAGTVFVIDDHGHYLKRFTRSGAYLSQWPVDNPKGIALGPDGNLYITRGLPEGGTFVSKYTKDGALIREWNAGLWGRGIAVDADGSVYVAHNLGPLRKFSASGQLIAQWGTQGTGDGQFSFLDGVAVDGLGHVFTADAGSSRVQKFTTTGTYLGQWGIPGSGNGAFEQPVRLVTSRDGGLVYVVDNQNSRIQVFTSTGGYLGQWGSAGGEPGQFRNPIGIAMDATENVFVTDANNGRVQVFGFGVTPVGRLSWGDVKQRFR